MSASIEPTTPADVAAFFPRASPWRICALTVRVDDRIVGIGGYYYNADGCRVAFVEASEADCKKHRLSLAKAARKFFSMCEEHGVTRLCAEADLKREAAGRWLHRLGFNEMHRTETKSLWQWTVTRPQSFRAESCRSSDQQGTAPHPASP